jgi:FtsP/CotA-like multicopper oxidase with cupredoxin domain
MKLHRRQFLALGLASAGSVVLTRCASGQPSTSDSAIAFPSTYASVGGVVELDLEAKETVTQWGDRSVSVLSYNGQIPGPRIEAKPGDTVRIRLTNALTQPTNLHYHGLHVSPNGHADNPFLSVASGEQLTYEFTIPQNHPAGLFWYHPHHHGHVADQVFGGLAGVFIIRGALDEIPAVKAAQEEVLVLKDFDVNANGSMNPPNHMALMRGREGGLVTVNGAVNPSFTLASGGLLRLRLLNASASRFYRLTLENHPLYLIATDGGAIAQPVAVDELLLAPGERAEVLVKGDQPSGTYQLLNLPYDRGGAMGMMGDQGMMPMHGMGGGMHNGSHGMGGDSLQSNPSQTPQPLATVAYQGAVEAIALPDSLIEVEELPEPDATRRIELSMGMDANGMAFLFNGQPFDPDRIDTVVKRDTVEEWELVNVDPDLMDHPFHLHINPFQVMSRNGQPEPYRAWKDTVVVKGGETVRIRIPFRDFVGKTVYHCHILDHEDLGMMGMMEIQD